LLAKTFKTIIGKRLLTHYDGLRAASIDGLYYSRLLILGMQVISRN